jgi:hypothetical protein
MRAVTSLDPATNASSVVLWDMFKGVEQTWLGSRRTLDQCSLFLRAPVDDSVKHESVSVKEDHSIAALRRLWADYPELMKKWDAPQVPEEEEHD